VLVRNLKSKPDFNGREGRVLEYDEARGRYSVRLLHSGTMAARTLQIKPENLADAPPKNGLEHLSAPELCLLTLSEHAAVSAAQMEGVIELLSSGQAGQQLTEADLSLLLRVVCCFGWHVASHRDRATGEETPALLPHPEHGSGLVLCTAPDRLERIGQVAGHPTPAGADKCATLVRGAALFLSDVLAQTGYLSLNPEDPTPGTRPLHDAHHARLPRTAVHGRGPTARRGAAARGEGVRGRGRPRPIRRGDSPLRASRVLLL